MFYIHRPKHEVCVVVEGKVLLIDPELRYQDCPWTYLTGRPGLAKQKGRHGGQEMRKKLEACYLYCLSVPSSPSSYQRSVWLPVAHFKLCLNLAFSSGKGSTVAVCTGVLFFERRQEHGNTQFRDSPRGTFTIFLQEYITEKKIFIFSFMDTCASLQEYV